ncbi:MAG: LacI family DNA-binding transcriptional regulator, partial [Opitutales bacterium]|nr:LacI family DNA-binding transcriptional regulator [Opitutales bacterium]
MKGKRVSLADIAAKLGISKSAVSLALNDSPMVSPKTRALVAKAARSMGYSRNSLVSSMMSSIKRGAVGSFSETIALVNGNRDEFALTNHPTLPKYCVGIREEAERLGYRINEFWLHDPKMTGERFFRALRSRGIRGGIILGHSFGSVFPPSFKRVWENFYFVSAGIKTRDPNLEMVSADHY